MELKETMVELEDLVSGIKLCTSNHKTALRTAISHLETLQKMKEMGGVKKKEIPERQDYTGNYDDAYDNGSEIGGAFAFNYALDLKDAELAGKLEELENVIENWFIALEKTQGLDQAKEIDEKGLWNADCKSVTFKEIKTGLATVIQELILGKKEE